MSDPYFWYVVSAYGSGLLLIGGLAVHIILDARRAKARLEDEDGRR